MLTLTINRQSYLLGQTLRHCAFLLLAVLTVSGCFEPIAFTPSEAVEIPSVYCILNPTDTQYLALKYVSPAGDRFQEKGINDAVITLYEYFDGEKGSERPYRQSSFSRVGDGLYRLVFAPKPGTSNIETGALCRLQICLPSGDTLRASTTMPDPGAMEQYIPVEAEARTFSFEANGFRFEPLPFEYEVLGQKGMYYRPDKAGYIFHPFNGAIYVSKVGWSKTDQAWFEEEELTTDREELTDAFNRTGTVFTHSADPAAAAAFPGAAGKPLHYRYLRFPGRQSGQDTVFITGDFKGPHYGDAWDATLALAKGWETYVRAKCEVQGLPFKPTMLSTGLAGFLRFELVSDSYDRYLKDLLLYSLMHDVSTDIVGIYDNTNIYTNIDGGVGVFGAKIEKQYYWTCGTWQF